MMRLGVLLLILIGCGQAAHGGCAGKILSVNAQAPLTYSPFAAWNAKQTLVITVQNTGSLACSYRISMAPGSYPLKFGAKLSFDIANASTAVSGAAPFSIVTPVLKPGQNAQLGALLTVFRGQAAISGVLAANTGFALTPAEATQGAMLLDQVVVPLSCIVPPIFEVNLAGSGERTSIQFANLAPRETAAVILQTRTTGNHRLEFQSQNRGFLILQGVSGQSARIPYSFALDGQPVALKAKSFLQFTTGAGETAHRLTFTIGDTSGKLAGTYSDVVTISIGSFL